MRKKELTKQQLLSYSITQNDDKRLCFDFSRLDKKVFFPVLAGIEEFGICNVESLTICLDLYYESCKSDFPSLKPTKPKQSKEIEPAILVESAFRQVPKAMTHILSMLERVLKSTISLNTIEFKSMIFTDDELSLIGSAISANTTLTTISFNNVPMFDKGFYILSRSFRRQGISEVKCRQCGLTDASIDSVKSLLAYNVSVQRETEWCASLELDGAVSTICMKRMDLSGNLFTISLLSQIADSLADIPMTLLDLTENQPMSEKQVNAIRKTLPHMNIRVNDGKPKRKKMKKVPKRDGPIDSAYLESLIRQNVSIKSSSTSKTPKSSSSYSASQMSLKKTKKKAKSAKPKPKHKTDDSNSEEQEVELAPGVVAVGKRAHEFAEFVRRLCDVAAVMVDEEKKRNV